MRRRRNKAGDALLGLILLVAFVGWLLSKVVDSTGVVAPVIIVLALVALIIWHKYSQRQKRIAALLAKYGDERIVQAILQRHFWQGQTSAQLLDSLGSPQGIDRKSMATRRREVWKYNPRGVNRFGLRITLDDDIVANWDQKQ
jgi:thiol:disulfide interchange protein